MEIQRLESCCSTVHLYGVSISSVFIDSKYNFHNFLSSDSLRQNMMNGKNAILYICDNHEIYDKLRKLGFKKKCSFNGAYRTFRKRPIILILDLVKFKKDINKLSLKDQFKNWVFTW